MHRRLSPPRRLFLVRLAAGAVALPALPALAGFNFFLSEYTATRAALIDIRHGEVALHAGNGGDRVLEPAMQMAAAPEQTGLV